MQHLKPLRNLRNKCHLHRQKFCNCKLTKEKPGHTQLVPHDRNIHEIDLEYKLCKMENILHQVLRNKHENWSRTRSQKIIGDNVKLTML